MAKRNTISWKHLRKDRKQWMHDGMIVTGMMVMAIEATPGFLKRKTEFMFDDMDVELMMEPVVQG